MLRNLEIFLPSAKSIGKTAHRFLSETLSSQPHTEAKANYAKLSFPALESSNERDFYAFWLSLAHSGQSWSCAEILFSAYL